MAKKSVAKPAARTAVVPVKTAVVKFDDADIPTFFKAPEESATNALAALAPTTFPYLSIKGKRFALVRNKEETPIMRADDDETPANAIEAVLVNTAQNFSKVFYDAEYVDGAKDKPTCYSNDGLTPAADVEDKQADSCKACEHDAWGTGKGGKGKACSDSLRLAIAFPDALNDPMLLRVPPASLKAVTEYAAMLSRKGVPMEGVVTKIKFDSEEATPRLIFSPVRFLNASQYQEVLTVAKAQIVQQIIGALAYVALPRAEKETEEIIGKDEDAKPSKSNGSGETQAKAPEKKPASSVTALAAKLKESLKSAASDD